MIGLDVGGANLKAVHLETSRHLQRPFALWQQPERLAGEIERLLADLGCSRHDEIAVTMTGEMCDCFHNRTQGVMEIAAAVFSAAQRFSRSRSDVHFYSVEGRFHHLPLSSNEASLLASSNWHASASWLARSTQSAGLWIDVGSTTCDVIAVGGGRVLSTARSDWDRMLSGELLYAGVERSNLVGIAAEIRVDNQPVALINELFATTLDIMTILGMRQANGQSSHTADGRDDRLEYCYARLARAVARDDDVELRPWLIRCAQELYQALRSRLSAVILQQTNRFFPDATSCSYWCGGQADRLIEEATAHAAASASQPLTMHRGDSPFPESVTAPAFAVASLASSIVV